MAPETKAEVRAALLRTCNSFPPSRSIVGAGFSALLLFACTQAPAPATPDPGPVGSEKAAVGAPRESRTKTKTKEQAPSTRGPMPIRGNLLRLATVRIESATDLAPGLPSSLSEDELETRTISAVKPGLWAAIDQHPARQIEGRGLRFVDLLSEDEELAPGGHQLILFVMTEALVSVQVHPFRVGSAEPSESPPSCLLWTPRLTYNGTQQLSEFSALALPLGGGTTRVRYELQALDTNWLAALEVPPGQLVGADKPPAGDLVIRANCIADSGETDVVERLVTVNPEPLQGEE